MGSTHKNFCYIMKYNGHPRKCTCKPFFNGMTDTQTIVWFELGYLDDSFLKMTKVSLTLQGKQTSVFIANDKIQNFKWKLEFWQIYIHFCERAKRFCWWNRQWY